MAQSPGLTLDQSWERYTRECHKYSMPRLTPVENLIRERTTKFKMKNYCPQSIGFWLAFETFFQNPKITVTHIDASNSPFTESGCYTLNDFLENSATLTHLNLGNCRIGFRGVQVMEEGLNYMKCITYLNLSGCNLRDTGGVIVVNAFRNNDTCKTLDLSHNSLYTETGRVLGEMLIRNDCLESLDLGWNSFYSENDCIVPLLAGLKKNTGLRRFVLSWNGMMCDFNVCDALKLLFLGNRTLEYVDLENNRLTGNMDEVAIGLRRAKKLREVKFGGNPMTDEDIALMFTEFKLASSSIETISLGQYKWITKDNAAILQKVLLKNPNVKFVFAGVMMSIPPVKADIKLILMDRIKSLAMKPKKAKLRKDIGHFFLQLLESEETKCSMDDWLEKCHAFGAKIDDPLCEQIAAEWQDPKSKRIMFIEIANFYLARHPTLPPNFTNRSSRMSRRSMRKSALSVK